MFRFEPVGTYLVNVCTNISCLLWGGEELLEHACQSLEVEVGGTTDDGMFTVEEAECIAACTEAPCLQVNYRYRGPVTPTTSTGWSRIFVLTAWTSPATVHCRG